MNKSEYTALYVVLRKSLKKTVSLVADVRMCNSIYR